MQVFYVVNNDAAVLTPIVKTTLAGATNITATLTAAQISAMLAALAALSFDGDGSTYAIGFDTTPNGGAMVLQWTLKV